MASHTGEATEAAFRARHRWAARRVAHLLKGLPDRPPLQAASEVIESASINVGLLVEGQPFLGSTVDVVSASGGLEGGCHSPVWRLLPYDVDTSPAILKSHNCQ